MNENKVNLNDPNVWYNKAEEYISLVFTILDYYHPVIHSIESPKNAVNTLPYQIGLACELLMKGYLISKGVKYEKIRRIGHDLEKLRQECLSFGDKRFREDDLMFLTDHLGERIMNNGGIRYPENGKMIVYPEFVKAMKILIEVTKSEEDLL